MPFAVVSHTCEICAGPGGTEPTYKVDKWGKRWVKGYVHRECKQEKINAAAIRRATAKAKRWEQAGQLTLDLPQEGAE